MIYKLNGLKMSSNKQKPLLVAVVGPTAVGKSDTAIRLAEQLGGEIISADSRLFYRGMDIGTAKPSLADQSRIPHHLIDVANPDEVWSLALFLRAVREIIPQIFFDHHHLPFLVGGTGQYVFSVLEGWNLPIQAPDHGLRRILDQMAIDHGKLMLYKWLEMMDPKAAGDIEPNNVRRTIRALEVIFLTGERFSTQRLKGESPYHSIMVGLTIPREELFLRIDQRIHRMLQQGFIEEVKTLLDQGYSPDLPTMTAIGYREIIAYLSGKLTKEDAIEQMRRSTKQFVRRQKTWFKERDENIHWFNAGEDDVENQIYHFILKWLEKSEQQSP
jgi:tRNA dimethylallyltransferase